MIEEVIDKESGAILFKKSRETLDLEYLLDKVELLEKRIEKLEDILNNQKETQI